MSLRTKTSVISWDMSLHYGQPVYKENTSVLAYQLEASWKEERRVEWSVEKMVGVRHGGAMSWINSQSWCSPLPLLPSGSAGHGHTSPLTSGGQNSLIFWKRYSCLSGERPVEVMMGRRLSTEGLQEEPLMS